MHQPPLPRLPSGPLGLAPVVVLSLLLAACEAHASPREPVVGGPCDGCEAVFQDRPTRLAASARIAPADEPGQPLVVEGVVTDRSGAPAAGIILYAYQTDATGVYRRGPRADTAADRHGVLRGFVRTDDRGRYRFDTVRPGAYPGRTIPRHIHMHVVEPGRCTYYIDDVVFTDDPLLTAAERASHDRGRGGSGIVTPTLDATERWHARRDITLGAGIADHRRCAARAR